MPANQSLYPADWKLIATCVKEAADWVCQECGKPCYRPGDGMKRLSRDMVLTVHHIDHNPRNCAADNLVALCTSCHLRADAQHHARNARRTRARKAGQMWLLEEALP